MDHKRWLQDPVGASFHFCSDWDRILAFLPWRTGEAVPAWHALHSANVRFLGWEICETADPVKFERSWAVAVEGHAQMLKAVGQNVDWLLNHQQVTRWWPEDKGDHTDPMPYFTKWGRSWGQFVSEVDQALRGVAKPVPPVVALPRADDWKAATLAKAHAVGVLSDLHQPGESVEMEELAAMGLRLHSRLVEVEQKLAAIGGNRA